MWEYTEKVKELYRNPKNVGTISDADGIGEVGSLICGDALKLYIKVDKKKNKIIDAKFQTFGCGSAIASSSALTEIIKGKTIEQALKITNEDIVNYLGGLPQAKMHCSVMGYEALQKAISDYKGEKIKINDNTKIICECFKITEDKIKRVIKENNLHTVDQVTAYTKAGGNCGKCKPGIIKILKDMGKYQRKVIKKKKKSLSTLQFVKKIQDTIDTQIRPSLQKDGGDIKLIDIHNNTIMVRLQGSCKGCISSKQTIKNFVEAKLKEIVSKNIIVKQV